MEKNNIKHVHLLGVGGTGMGALAGLFVEKGYKVSGSDQKLYSPMSEQLAKLDAKIYEGYSPQNIQERPDLVVIGNVIRRDNPEAQEVLKQDIPYCSMPQALTRFFLGDKKSIVVAGTHGKTTTATLLAWLFTSAGEDPSFFIGGVGKNFQKNAHLGQGRHFVFEGDEYDTAFFDKGPKFVHYQPQVVLLTSVEFDHADIYRNLPHLKEAFKQLLRIIPADGLLIANGEDPNVLEIVKEAKCRVQTYGLHEGVDYYPRQVAYDEGETSFEMSSWPTMGRFKIGLAGEHNLLNAVGAMAVVQSAGVLAEKIRQGLSTYQGVKRRQEVFAYIDSVTLIDDFAHHPTAVAKTIAAIRQKYPGRRLWALFEPRSNTSRRNVFKKEFIEALALADRVIMAKVFAAEKIPAEERLDVQSIADTLMRRGIDAHYIPQTDFLLDFVTRNVNRHDVILVMSNGSFDNVLPRLEESLKRRRIV